jgi:hypothetical protein
MNKWIFNMSSSITYLHLFASLQQIQKIQTQALSYLGGK